MMWQSRCTVRLYGQKRTLGKDHPSTLDSINNLAGLLFDQRKYDEAEPLYREALEGRKRTLGNDHPSTFNSINKLANLLKEQSLRNEGGSLGYL